HDIFQHQRITGVDPVVVGRFGELQSQDTEVRQVLPMDTGEGLGNDRLQAEVARGDGRVLTRGTLPVVLPTDDEVAGGVGDLEGTPGIGKVDTGEGEFGELGHV